MKRKCLTSYKSILIGLSCSISVSSFGQMGTARLTLVEDHVRLDRVLEDIERQTGYTYLMDGEVLEEAGILSCSVRDVSVGELLDTLLRDKALYWVVDARSIDIRMGGVVHGRVVDEKGEAVPAASITVSGDHFSRSLMSDEAGRFQLHFPASIDLLISSIGFEHVTYHAGRGRQHPVIVLHHQVGELAHITVSNGFEDIPAERATGSFAKVDSPLIERSVDPNLINRLNGVTPSMLVNQNIIAGTNQSTISIRGRSTIFANPDPLLVIDNFPYAGDINNINPEDIESVSILKDAAAASIWGTRAANGVIVVKTKTGKYRQAPLLSFSTSLTVGQKPNLYYTPILSPSEYIDVETFLFNQGYDDAKAADPSHPAISPVGEILLQQQAGTLSAANAQAQINTLRGQDTRQDQGRYFYQPSTSQQYALSLAGGSDNNRYYLAAGLDRDIANLARNSYQRITVTGNNTYKVIPDKLELSTRMAFTASTTDNNNFNVGGAIYPYVKLADASGQALAVPFPLRLGYVDTVGGGQLLDWHYRPLDELRNANNTTKLTDYRMDFGLDYHTPLTGLAVQALYQYGQGSSDNQNLQSLQMFYTRNLINEFTQVGPTGQLTYPIPVGGILDEYLYTYHTDNGRLQLNYDRSFSGQDLHLLLGSEIQDVESRGVISRLYGYNSVSQSSQPVASFVNFYPQYSSGNLGLIPNLDNTVTTADHYWSYYFNGSYKYQQRYILTASSRVDQSNLFGVNTNNKSVPLWSAGLAWELSREGFYHSDALPFLKLRLTDGYNGNVYTDVTGGTTVFSAVGIASPGPNSYGSPAAYITNPPNPNLRWEKVQVFNAGIDFATRHHLLDGSVEYYTKTGKDLIGASGIDPTSGITQYTGNTANMFTRGIDLTLHTQARIGSLQWNTTLLFSFVRDKVTRYLVRPPTIISFLGNGFITPLAGRPLYSVYALPWAGLDPSNGNPRGYYQGHISEDYTDIQQSTDYSTLHYRGPVNPPFFGSWRNGFSWRRWELSALFTWKFGDYFLRNSIQYYDLFNGLSLGHPDYERRWQKPGDEKHTYVPSGIYPADPTRDQFYASSDVLVEKGDLIRWQDLRISYELNKKVVHKLPVQHISVFIYANNIGILWRANDQHLDPDALASLPNPRTIAVGIKTSF